MKTLRFRLTGVAPLLMHNGQTSDPLNDYAKQIKRISSKRNKSEADHEQMANIEYIAGLYTDQTGRPCIPAPVLEAAIVGKGGAARKERAGKQAAAAVFVEKDAPLEYDGPKNVEEMLNDPNMRLRVAVRVQSNKVMRTRPMIPAGWTAEVEVVFNEKLVDEEAVIRWMKVAGEEVGIMDWRPKYGRFAVELLDN